MSLSLLLRDAGYAVGGAGTGNEALKQRGVATPKQDDIPAEHALALEASDRVAKRVWFGLLARTARDLCRGERSPEIVKAARLHFQPEVGG